ncbi:identical protein binding, partial [Halocaridina rubra]
SLAILFQLQELAFGGSKGKNKKKGGGKGSDSNKKDGSPPKSNGQPGSSPTIDDDWQRRDSEFVRDENERTLREALMLSKLDFEEKQTFYAQIKKEQEEEQHKGGKVKKKKEKPVPMSLEQFNNLSLNQKTKKKEPSSNENNEATILENQKFFDNVEEVAKKTLEREQRHENYKATAEQFGKEILVKQYEEQLEKQEFEIQALRLEVDSLKNDLKMVKGRNKKLCEVICSAEMKSKAELVVELDKMSRVRDELTQEVSNLSGQLEQERSKVNQLTLDLKKSHGKKKQTADGNNKE